MLKRDRTKHAELPGLLVQAAVGFDLILTQSTARTQHRRRLANRVSCSFIDESTLIHSLFAQVPAASGASAWDACFTGTSPASAQSPAQQRPQDSTCPICQALIFSSYHSKAGLQAGITATAAPASSTQPTHTIASLLQRNITTIQQLPEAPANPTCFLMPRPLPEACRWTYIMARPIPNSTSYISPEDAPVITHLPTATCMFSNCTLLTATPHSISLENSCAADPPATALLKCVTNPQQQFMRCQAVITKTIPNSTSVEASHLPSCATRLLTSTHMFNNCTLQHMASSAPAGPNSTDTCPLLKAAYPPAITTVSYSAHNPQIMAVNAPATPNSTNLQPADPPACALKPLAVNNIAAFEATCAANRNTSSSVPPLINAATFFIPGSTSPCATARTTPITITPHPMTAVLTASPVQLLLWVAAFSAAAVTAVLIASMQLEVPESNLEPEIPAATLLISKNKLTKQTKDLRMRYAAQPPACKLQLLGEELSKPGISINAALPPGVRTVRQWREWRQWQQQQPQQSRRVSSPVLSDPLPAQSADLSWRPVWDFSCSSSSSSSSDDGSLVSDSTAACSSSSSSSNSGSHTSPVSHPISCSSSSSNSAGSHRSPVNYSSSASSSRTSSCSSNNCSSSYVSYPSEDEDFVLIGDVVPEITDQHTSIFSSYSSSSSCSSVYQSIADDVSVIIGDDEWLATGEEQQQQHDTTSSSSSNGNSSSSSSSNWPASETSLELASGVNQQHQVIVSSASSGVQSHALHIGDENDEDDF
jgi:hypothetical protein